MDGSETEILIRYGHLDAHARDRVLDQFYLTYHAGVGSGIYVLNKTISVATAFLAVAIPSGFLSIHLARIMGMSPADAVSFLYCTIIIIEAIFFGAIFSNRAKTRYKERLLEASELGLSPSQLTLHARNIHGGIVKGKMRWQDVTSLVVEERGERTAIKLTDTRGKKIDLFVDCIQTIEERQILRHFLLSRLPQVDVSPASVALTRVGSANDVPFTKLWSQALQDARPRVRTSVLAPDTVLQNGNYLIRDLIASGGQGAVYVAALRNVEGVRDVVLKEYVLPDVVHQAEHKAAVEQFEHEVRLLSKIDHPGVIKMYDAFVEDHRAYLVLEQIHGVSLKEYVDKHGAMEEARVIRLAVQMCDMLSMLHSLSPSVMHLDFSPDNILIDERDHLTTIDFNVSIEENAIRTRTVMGKQRYMAPEQYRGKPTTRSDLYALGGSLFFLLTGAEPQPIAVASPSKKNSAVSAQFNSIIEKATALEEADRFQTADEFRNALQQLQSTLPALSKEAAHAG